jgi:hypothetical protein
MLGASPNCKVIPCKVSLFSPTAPYNSDYQAEKKQPHSQNPKSNIISVHLVNYKNTSKNHLTQHYYV